MLCYVMYTMNTLQTIEFDNQNQNKNISGTIYHSDLCLYVKQTGGHQLTADIKHGPVALTRKEI